MYAFLGTITTEVTYGGLHIQATYQYMIILLLNILLIYNSLCLTTMKIVALKIFKSRFIYGFERNCLSQCLKQRVSNVEMLLWIETILRHVKS